jgi:F-type H+-transporting ATPase subunit b
MILGTLFAFAARYAESEEGGSKLLSVDYGLAFWTVLIFLILLLILKKVAWKPILTALDEREQKIKESLELAEKAKQDAAIMLEENKKSMAKADEAAQKVLAESKVYAEQVKTQLLEQSKEQAQKMIAEASKEIERKKQEAFTELKDQVAEISVLIAEKLIQKNLDSGKQKEVIDSYIKDIRKN